MSETLSSQRVHAVSISNPECLTADGISLDRWLKDISRGQQRSLASLRELALRIGHSMTNGGCKLMVNGFTDSGSVAFAANPSKPNIMYGGFATAPIFGGDSRGVQIKAVQSIATICTGESASCHLTRALVDVYDQDGLAVALKDEALHVDGRRIDVDEGLFYPEFLDVDLRAVATPEAALAALLELA